MLLEINTTHKPATDLGYLLHKHPDKLQTVELSVGNAHVFYPEATEDSCTACLLLDINPIDLVRGDRGRGAFLQEHYVNDRPYTSNSFLSTALVKAFGSAVNGTCHTKPELVTTSIPLKARVHSLKVDCEKEYINNLFEPLGYKIFYEIIQLDSTFPSWGESKVVNLTIEKTTTLKEFLSQLYVFMMVLDNDRHYWVSKNDIDVLIRRGENWLENHPEKDWITKRYLKNLRTLTNQALLKLANEDELMEEQSLPERRVNLHQQRLNTTAELLKASGAESVLDLGCGEGKLLKLLLKEGQFRKIAGMDVSFGELQKAKENLYLDQASPTMRDRIKIFQGSVTYKDERLRNFDAAALVEVIEHLDEERLPAMEKVVFGFAKPTTVILTTPNAEYNVVFEKLQAETFRHDDHRFEWTRKEFADWCNKICSEFNYQVEIYPVGQEVENIGAPSQLAVFKKEMKEVKLPEISLVLLVGPSSSGKLTFAEKYFLSTEILSSDYCRAIVSDDENNLSATDSAFEILHFIAAKRLKLGKLTVIDALNLRKEDRAKLVQLAKDNYALAAAIVLETPIKKLFDRHDERTDRNFSKHVLERQYDDFKRSLRTIEKEGFSYTYFLNPEEEINIHRQKLWNNKKDEWGAFDIIGDIHGCFDELLELFSKLNYTIERKVDGHFEVQNPENRRAIFLGDLTDRGDKSPDVLRLVMDMVKAQKAFCICGNHDEKLSKFLNGKNVNLNYGLDKTVQQLEGTTKEFRTEIKVFLNDLIAHYVFDDGKLVVAHGGLPEEMHGRAAAAVRAFCLFGETTGEIDEFGLPVRYDWAKNYKGKAMVVYGHTPVPETEWLNNTLNIDTGCVFGGKLSALRYPEKEIVQVAAKEIYSEPIRPIQPTLIQLSAQQEFDDLLDIEIINGKNLIETKFHTKVIVREENAIAALEVMSRFAINPKWLIHLPPTMSPPETSKLPNYLEHPNEVFNYYIKNGIKEVICEEKHMGSRAIAIVCKEPDVARNRFGLLKSSLGIVYTRTGRQFFEQKQTETDFLEMLNKTLTESNFWEKLNTDWVCLDGELMPWSAKAKELLVKQYAAVGSAATTGLTGSIAALTKAKARGIAVDHLVADYSSRKDRIEKYITSYRNYCRETNGIEGLVYAPFHILGTEWKTYFDKQHTWHLEIIKAFCNFNTKHLMVTANILVDLQNTDSIQTATDWWTTLTSKGGEGMVVKPLEYIKLYKGRTVQPAMKCRGSEYLRIIYGPEYDSAENIQILKERNVKVKRDLAIKEFTLGLESLERFVNKEPLRRIHECVFGVLAMESESVDPRL